MKHKSSHKPKPKSKVVAPVAPASDRVVASVSRKGRRLILKLQSLLRCYKKPLLFGALGMGFVGLVTGAVYFSVPAAAQFEKRQVAVNQPIRLLLSHPVRSSLTYKIYPATKGTWRVSKDLLGGVTELIFQPAHPLRPNATYRMQLADMRSMLTASSEPGRVLSLTTQKLQPVTAVSPSSSTPAAVDSKVIVRMPFPNHNVRHLVLTSNDAKLASSNPATTDDTQFIWHYAKPLKQGQTYHLQLKDINRPISEQVLQNITFTTVAEPQVTQATTTDHLYPNQPVVIAFAQDMVLSDKDFTFDCKGTGKWQDARTYSFMPDTLPAATTCPYTLLKGSRDKQGGVIESDQNYTTSAPGETQVLSATPGGSGIGLSASVSVTFDQPVDHTSAQNAFSTAPATTGSFTWNDNTMVFRPSGLDYQTTYNINVNPGVVSLYGLPGTQAFSSHFTTVTQTIKLAVPSYRQQYALSCEESSLRMALAYRGITVSDMDVLQQVGYNPQPRDTATNTWQNPYDMYVGDVNGKEGVTGWGAYGPPIAAASQKLGRSATYVAGITPQQISQAIHGNNPVVVWGVMTGETPRLDSWNTSDDGVVHVVANAHVRTVYGVVGSPSNPIGFYLQDPLAGSVYWTTAQLQANMTANGQIGSQGVIVY